MVKTVGVNFPALTLSELVEVALGLQRNADRYRIERNRLRLQVSALEKQVYLDGLTQVGNRRAFDKALANELARAKRGMGRPLSLAIFDLDFFKKINDTYGHPAGDKILVKMGELLRHHARSTDFAGRIGGEEFAFLLPSTSAEGALHFVERFREVVSHELNVRAQKGKYGVTIRATASFGLVTWDEEESLEALLVRADAALYVAKQNGRNKVHQA